MPPWRNYTAQASNMPPWGPWRNYTAEASMLASQIDSNELPRYVIVAQTVIAVSSSLVNFIFLIIIFIVPEIRTMPSNLLLASLAVANLLFCSNVGLLQLAVQTHSHGENLCKTLLVLAVFTICLSCFSRCIIAIDRYYAISVPFKYLFYVSDFYALSLIALVWTCSLGLACLPLLHWKKLVPSSDQCINHAESVPVVVMLVVVIMVPAVIMLFVYSSIFYWAYMQIRIIKMQICYPHANVEVPIMNLRRYSMAASLMLPKNANLNIECIVQEQTKLRKSTVADSSFTMDDPKGSPPDHPSTLSSQRLAISVSSNQCVVKFASKNQNSDMDFSNPGPSHRKGTTVDLIQYSATTSTISSPTPASVGGTTPTIERESYQKQRSLRSNSLVEKRQLRKFSRQASVVQENALRNSTLKAFIVVNLTFGAFIIAWTPFLVLAVRSIGQPDKVSDTEGSIALLIGSLSSITDPFIYGLINQPFRSAAKRRILRRFFNIIAMDM